MLGHQVLICVCLLCPAPLSGGIRLGAALGVCGCQVAKEGLAARVVDEQQVGRLFREDQLATQSLYTFQEDSQEDAQGAAPGTASGGDPKGAAPEGEAEGGQGAAAPPSAAGEAPEDDILEQLVQSPQYSK